MAAGWSTERPKEKGPVPGSEDATRDLETVADVLAQWRDDLGELFSELDLARRDTEALCRYVEATLGPGHEGDQAGLRQGEVASAGGQVASVTELFSEHRPPAKGGRVTGGKSGPGE